MSKLKKNSIGVFQVFYTHNHFHFSPDLSVSTISNIEVRQKVEMRCSFAPTKYFESNAAVVGHVQVSVIKVMKSNLMMDLQ